MVNIAASGVMDLGLIYLINNNVFVISLSTGWCSLENTRGS